VGITEPALYRHFKNKDHILQEVCHYITCLSRERVEQILQMQILPTEKLRRIFLEMCIFFEEMPSAAAILFTEEMFKNQSDLSEVIYNTMQSRHLFLGNLIQEAQKRGEINPSLVPEDLAFMFQGTLRLLVTQWRLSGNSFDLEERGKKLVDSLLLLWQKTL